MTWKHISAIALGLCTAIAGGIVAPAASATALIALGASVVAGALGNAKPEAKKGVAQ